MDCVTKTSLHISGDVHIILFVDDIILYKHVSSVNDADCLQSDLESLQHWEEKWLLKFNVSKCYVLKISRAKWSSYNYQLHNTFLNELNSCKYLGVTIQSDLKWSQHVLYHLLKEIWN